MIGRRIIGVLVFLVAAWPASAEQDDCIPLSDRLSVCDVLEDARIGFVDATPDAVLMSVAMPKQDRYFVVYVELQPGISIQDYASKSVTDARGRLVVAQTAGSEAASFPALEYTLLTTDQADQAPESHLWLFVDTGVGLAVISAREAPESDHRHTFETAARVAEILRVNE